MVKRLEWTPELVNSFWNGVAQTRLDELSFGRVAGPAFLEAVRPFLKPGGRHLDYGAGSGHIIRLLVDQGYPTAGFDPSPERQAALLHRVGERPGFLGAVGADSGEQFDVVLLMEVIEHLLDPDLSPMLARVNRFLPVGGRFIVSTPNSEDLELQSAYCPSCRTLFHRWQHVRSFTPESLAALLAGAGFEREFLGLADFADDAAVYEASRNQAARDRVVAEFRRDRPDEAARLAQELADIRRQMQAALKARLDEAYGAASWRKRKRLTEKLRMLLDFRRLHGRTIRLLDTLSGAYLELEDRVTRALAILEPQRSDRAAAGDPAGLYDLRYGRADTILYVGRKVRPMV
jgi:2-polyprenyl-3-methyl-5-hydroxy-6-metoxy-1,4-benzoquinol methylase